MIATLFASPDSWTEIFSIMSVLGFIGIGVLFALDNFYLRKSKFDKHKSEEEESRQQFKDSLDQNIAAHHERILLLEADAKESHRVRVELNESIKELKDATNKNTEAQNKNASVVAVLLDRAKRENNS